MKAKGMEQRRIANEFEKALSEGEEVANGLRQSDRGRPSGSAWHIFDVLAVSDSVRRLPIHFMKWNDHDIYWLRL